MTDERDPLAEEAPPEPPTRLRRAAHAWFFPERYRSDGTASDSALPPPPPVPEPPPPPVEPPKPEPRPRRRPKRAAPAKAETGAPAPAPEAPPAPPPESEPAAPGEPESAAPAETRPVTPGESESAAPPEGAAPGEAESAAEAEREPAAPGEPESAAPPEGVAPGEAESAAEAESEPIAPGEAEPAAEAEREPARPGEAEPAAEAESEPVARPEPAPGGPAGTVEPADGGQAPKAAAPDDGAAAAAAAAAMAAETVRQHLRGVLEALIFASAEPMATRDLARLAKAETKVVKEILVEMQASYQHRGFRLDEVAGGYAFRTSPAFAPFVRELVAKKPVRMSRAQLETLAIVAYKQPITRPEIDDIRGVDSGPVLKSLLERGLVRILGKKEDVGRPMLYGTTGDFLEFFGMKSVADLPTLREFTELSDDSRRAYEREMGEEPPEEGASFSLGGLAGEGDLEGKATKPNPEDFEDPDSPTAGPSDSAAQEDEQASAPASDDHEEGSVVAEGEDDEGEDDEDEDEEDEDEEDEDEEDEEDEDEEDEDEEDEDEEDDEDEDEDEDDEDEEDEDDEDEDDEDEDDDED